VIRASVIGATGYAGQELVRLLSSHPDVSLKHITSETYAGKPMKQVYPYLDLDLMCESMQIGNIAADSDVVFTSLPHGHAMNIARGLLEAGCRLIDLGADFRLRDPAVFERWYRQPHSDPELLAQAVYGLPELRSQVVSDSRLIANPGCYPTSVLLALAPLSCPELKPSVDINGIIIDSKSGVSGAGRSASLDTHFCEVNENLKAYAVGGTHRHTPEIEQELSRLIESQVTVAFTPHLIPITRGILSTIYVPLVAQVSEEEVMASYARFYLEKPFVRVYPLGVLPQTKHVSGSNYCAIGLRIDPRSRRLVLISAIDNLVKGAAGQAIQNMNLVFGLPEDRGLKAVGIYP